MAMWRRCLKNLRKSGASPPENGEVFQEFGDRGMMIMAVKRLHAYFSGRVQGVGFRYTTERFAEGIEVTGFVRNLPDERVELLVEGEEKVLEGFLYKIRNSFLKNQIEGSEVRWLEATNELKSFSIV